MEAALKEISTRFATGAGRAGVAIIHGADRWSGTVGRDGAVAERSGRYLLYSFTKTLMAAAALRLVDRGRLDLDHLLEEPAVPGSIAGGITLRQLLHHDGGLADYGGIPEYNAAVKAGQEPWSDDEYWSRTGAGRRLFEPGRGWAYSNIGYMLVRRILCRETGLGFGAMLADLVFKPLGVTDAFVPVTRADLEGLDLGPSRYLGNGGPPVPVAARYHPGWVSHGVAAATPDAAACLLHGILAGTLLPRPLLDLMTAARRVADPMPGRPWIEPGYGLGLMVELAPGGSGAAGHTGSGPGCSPAVFHFRGKRQPLTICVITGGEDVGQAETMAVAASSRFP
ncbi:beta-lactamase family protein [Skermanella sp. TT6]|uniref:Beta-lactamase family protein n=1 Tax=Skermanella cutis TaxID=2775420 RepID=A0ABX7BDL9_9PROT|nr:beta-lactamase family protein [Skermanella sp. TT6]